MQIVTKEEIRSSESQGNHTQNQLAIENFDKLKGEYKRDFDNWRNDRLASEVEPEPPILVEPGDSQHGFYEVVQDIAPHPSDPMAIERERSYREGYLAGAEEASFESYETIRAEVYGPLHPQWMADQYSYLLYREVVQFYFTLPLGGSVRWPGFWGPRVLLF